MSNPVEIGDPHAAFLLLTATCEYEAMKAYSRAHQLYGAEALGKEEAAKVIALCERDADVAKGNVDRILASINLTEPAPRVNGPTHLAVRYRNRDSAIYHEAKNLPDYVNVIRAAIEPCGCATSPDDGPDPGYDAWAARIDARIREAHKYEEAARADVEGA